LSSKVTRRQWLQSGGLALAGLLAPRLALADDPGVKVIHLRSDGNGARVWFDPVGLLVRPGTTIRWVNESNVHTATAYHPDNDDHPLRIPRRAEPWDSGYLVNAGDRFEVTLKEPGVYDYYCKPHEAAGMVGRIIVGEPTGPGSRPFDWFKDDPARNHWKSVPGAARDMFPAIDEIMTKRVVRRL